MALKHKKVSGLANVDSSHVGGADWDDDHRYSAGLPFVAGRFSALFSSGGGVTKSQSPNFYWFDKEQAGWYRLMINPGALPVAPGATLNYSTLVTVYPSPLPTGWSVNAYGEDGVIDIIFSYGGSTADPTFTCRVEGALIAEVA